ncbi:MAG: cation-translocating P-type ATPase [Nocardioidaceae bacterium]
MPSEVAEASTQEGLEVLASLGTDPERGLGSAEVASRLERDGPNELTAAPGVPRWRRLLDQLDDPLVYLLLAAVAISVVAWFAEGASGLPVDAIVIAVILVANSVIGYLQEARAEAAVGALRDLTEVQSTVLRDGSAGRLASSRLVRGDLLLLAEGDSVGADARLLDSASLHVAESSLTGESQPVEKDATTLSGPLPLGDRADMVFKGTVVISGTGRAVVTRTGMHTEVGAIARLLDEAVQTPTPLEVEIARVGRTLGIAVVLIALVVMATIWVASGVHTTADAVTVLLLGVSLAVAAVPEGLPAILSVVLSIGVQRMAGREAIVKRLSSVETLGSASVICSDKTGTLTRNEMTLQRVVTASGTTHVTGVGYAPVGEVQSGGEAVDDPDLLAEATVVLSGGSLASDAVLQEVDGGWQVLGDPTEGAFLVAERKLGVRERRMARFTRVAEIPFTSERKIMSTIERDHEHDDLVLVSKGAPDVLLGHCSRLRSGGTVVPLTEEMRARILATVEELSEGALRTLSVAYRTLRPDEVGPTSPDDPVAVPLEVTPGLEDDLVFAGTVGIIDPARAEAAVAVAEAHRAGIRVVMITGDHPATALRIARDLGIAEPGQRALTGAQIEDLDAPGLQEASRSTSVYARVAPEHKLRIVDALQADRNIVAMTGDGVNDAPALKSADIGVAMGRTGTEVTKEASAMILADDNFATIVVAVRQGRVIFDNIKKFLRYLLSSNMGEVLTVFGGVVLAGWIGLDAASSDTVVLPLLATQILWVNLVTDSAPALAMGVDPETDDVMARRPRQLDDRVIDARMWSGVVMLGLVIAAATLFTIDVFLPGGLVEGHDSLDVARTAGFTTLVLAQLFNAFNSRSETTSAFRRPFVNRWLWGAVAFVVVAQVLVVEVPLLQHAFGTASLDPGHWLVCAGTASAVLWFDELRKQVSRARHAARDGRGPGTP